MARAIPIDELPVFTRHDLPKTNFDYQKGAAFLVHKPKGWTSFDVVKFLRTRVEAKTGHAGTLDPLAEGLLILCCGKATKSISQFQERSKCYLGDVIFGASTASYDAETDIEEEAPYEHITGDKIKKVLNTHFKGDIQQYPPIYSAIKQKGKRMYELAREGKEVDVKPRIVTIHEIKLVNFDPPAATLKIHCGGGTYVRSIAHDLGTLLDSRAYLDGLIRTAIGEFRNEEALTTDQIQEIFSYG